MTCRYQGRGNPRTIPGRHEPECADETCPGCQVCVIPHCRICNVAHTDGTCPECMAETREALREIARMCDEAAREAGAKALEDVADVLMEHHHGGRVHSVEAWVECLCGERLPCEFEGPPFHDPAWDDDAALPSDALALVHHQAALIAGLPSLRGAPPTEAPIPEELWEQEHAAYRAEQDTEPTEGES